MCEKLVKFEMPRIAKKKLRSLSEEEVNLILKYSGSLRNQCIITLMVDTGLRLTEICNLNWGDVNILKGTIEVLTGKGRKYRLVACGARTKKLLKRYQMKEGKNVSPTSPLFITEKFQYRITSRGMQAIMFRISQQSGVEFSAHALRRTFAKLALKAGMDLIYIQRMMGHENLETTRRYIQDLDDRDVIMAAMKYSPMDWLKK
jgi:integrase